MGRLNFTVRHETSAPRDKVWAVLADGAGWKNWAGILMSSLEREGVPAPDGVGAIRRLGPPLLGSREEIVEWDPPSHMAYTVLSGIPVKDYRAEIYLGQKSGGSVSSVGSVGSGAVTVIEWSGTFDTKVPGTGAVLRAGLRTMIGRFARKAAAYAEKS